MHSLEGFSRDAHLGKIPTPIKIKLALPPPPPSQKNEPPPLKRRMLWARGVSSRKNPKMPGAHKDWHSHFRPQNCGRKNYRHEAFSEHQVPFCRGLFKVRSGPGKPSQFMNFSQGHSGTKVQCESCLFSQGETPEFTKMGEIHELFVLPLSLVWFAGATPDLRGGGVKEAGEFHSPVRGTMFARDGAVTPGPSRECDITFFVQG